MFVLQVRLTCLQSCISIFQHCELRVATPLIHSVGSPVISHLLNGGAKPASDADISVWLEAVRMLETLIAKTEQENSTYPSRHAHLAHIE